MKNKIKKKLGNYLVIKENLENLKGTTNFLSFRIDSLENELKEFKNEFMKFKDQVLKTLDWLVGAFKKFDEEHTILTGQYSKVNEELVNHETRITTFEKKSSYK